MPKVEGSSGKQAINLRKGRQSDSSAFSAQTESKWLKMPLKNAKKYVKKIFAICSDNKNKKSERGENL